MKAVAFLVLSTLFGQIACADQWELPSAQGAISSDGDTVLRIVPAHEGAKPTASIYRRSRGDDLYRCELTFELVNRVAPVLVAVANGGEWFVTIDEWGSAGYSNAVVLYDREGRHVRTWTLEELMTPEEIGTLRVTKSSRDWASSVTITDTYQGSVAFVYPPRDPKDGAPTRLVAVPLQKDK